MGCECITNVSNLLRAHNASLITTLFSNPERVVITTEKIDVKKRGKTPPMVATCCPFCGVRYEADSSPLAAILEAPVPPSQGGE